MFIDTIGNIYLQLGRYDEAVEVFHEATEHELSQPNPESRFLSLEYNNLGVAYLYRWRLLRDNRENLSAAVFEREKMAVLEPALEAFGKSLEYDSDDRFSSFDSYINIISWMERDSEFAAEFELSLDEAEDFRARYALGKLVFNEAVDEMDLGRSQASGEAFQAAANQFELAAKLSPTEHLFWFNYAYALERLGRLEASIEMYTQAIYLNPVFIEAHHNLGQLRMRNQEHTAAIANFEEVLRLFPEHVSANLNLAKSYIQLGDFEQARQHVSTVLSASPQNQEALTLLEQLGSQS